MQDRYGTPQRSQAPGFRQLTFAIPSRGDLAHGPNWQLFQGVGYKRKKKQKTEGVQQLSFKDCSGRATWISHWPELPQGYMEVGKYSLYSGQPCTPVYYYEKNRNFRRQLIVCATDWEKLGTSQKQNGRLGKNKMKLERLAGGRLCSFKRPW